MLTRPCAVKAAPSEPRRNSHPTPRTTRDATSDGWTKSTTIDAIHPTSAVPASNRSRASSRSIACRRSSMRSASSARRRCSSICARSSSSRAWSRSNASFNAATTTFVSRVSSWPASPCAAVVCDNEVSGDDGTAGFLNLRAASRSAITASYARKRFAKFTPWVCSKGVPCPRPQPLVAELALRWCERLARRFCGNDFDAGVGNHTNCRVRRTPHTPMKKGDVKRCTRPCCANGAVDLLGCTHRRAPDGGDHVVAIESCLICGRAGQHGVRDAYAVCCVLETQLTGEAGL